MLPVLAAFQFLSAWQVRRLAVAVRRRSAADVDATPPRSRGAGASGCACSPRRRTCGNLAALVLLGTTSAALVDYLFKAQAVETFGRGDNLLRFFALYYAATSLITFVVQTSSSRFVLERFGLGADDEHAVGRAARRQRRRSGRAGLRQPDGRARRRIGVPRLAVPRRLRAVLHADSGGREARRQVDHRRRRSIAWAMRVGGGLVRVASCFSRPRRPVLGDSRPRASPARLRAIVAASRLNRGYIAALEKSLLNRGVELDLVRRRGRHDADADAPHAQPDQGRRRPRRATTVGRADAHAPAMAAARVDPDVQDILWLRSRDRDQVVRGAAHARKD